MSENNQKHQENDGKEAVDYEWEARKTANRILDVLTMIEELAVKIRSNSGRISRIQAELKRFRDGGEWEEPEEGEERLYEPAPPINLHDMSAEELDEALKGVTRID